MSSAGASAAARDEADTLLEELEQELDDDFDLGGFRERRLTEMRKQVQQNQALRESDHGKYTEYKNEKDLIAASAKAKRSVIHFYHRDFRRCKIMDKHLQKLAAKHVNTLFLTAEVSNVPFLVSKLEVQVLPCVVGFVSGVSKMKIVGFEELEGGDNFSTASLELTMIQCDVINTTPVNYNIRAMTSGSGEHKIRTRTDGYKGGEMDSDSD